MGKRITSRDENLKFGVRIVSSPNDIEGLCQGDFVAVIQEICVPQANHHSTHIREGVFDGNQLLGRGFYTVEPISFTDGTQELVRVKYRFDPDRQTFSGEGLLYCKPVNKRKKKTCALKIENFCRSVA